MPEQIHPVAVAAADVPARTKPSNYPLPFSARMAGGEKRQLGDIFGLTNFGVNLTLRTDEGRTQLAPGLCAGFKAGTGNGHCLINETTEDVLYLEVGDRTPGDEASYPDEDLKALLVEGQWRFVHRDGTPHP